MIKLTRLGKVAILASISEEEEEKYIKQIVNKTNFRLAITFVTGLTTEIKTTFVKSVVACAINNNVIQKTPGQVHAVVHAALDAVSGVILSVPAEASLKLKVGIVSDGSWIAVAVYGDSAFSVMTNHERAGLGVMHLNG